MESNLRRVSMRFVGFVLLFTVITACQQATIVSPDNTQTTISENISIPIGGGVPDVLPDIQTARANDTAPLVTTATGPNLLNNPNFENGSSNWVSCGAALSSGTGVSGLGLNVANGCMYQDVAVQPNTNYTLSCQVRQTNTAGWSGMGFSITDASFNGIASAPSSQINSTSWSTYSSSITTPANSTYASIWFYTGASIIVDNCSFAEETANNSGGNLLSNGSFNDQSAWNNCGTAGNYWSGDSSLIMWGSSCVYQTVEATPGTSYTLSCTGNKRSVDTYTSVTLSMLNSSWAAIASNSNVVTSETPQTITVPLTAPANASYIGVTIYNNGFSAYQDCSLITGSAPPPVTGDVATTVHPVPLPDGSFYPYPNQYPSDNESAQAVNNILVNPTFANQSGWQNCATANGTIEGGQLNISPGVCFYQDVAAVAGTTYTLTCRAEMNLPTYSVFLLNMISASGETLASETQTLHTSSRQWRIQLQAPIGTSKVSIGFYTENNASYDYCYLTPLAPPNLASEEIYAPIKNMEVMVPIYVNPEVDLLPWNHVIATAQEVPTTVVINPSDRNIADCQNDLFSTTLGRLQTANIDTVGYVATGYTQTPIATVKADIDLLAQCNGLDGVFFDEIKVATLADANYYEQICTYARSVFGNSGKFVVNAGTNIQIPITNEFCNVALIFEFFEYGWDDFAVFGYQGAWTDPATSIMIHSENTDMQSAVDLAYSRKIDYIYITDATMPNPWTRISNYWYTFMDYVAQKNAAF